MSLVYRGVVQMVERLIWDQEAVGSSPAPSTIKTDSANIKRNLSIDGSNPFMQHFARSLVGKA